MAGKDITKENTETANATQENTNAIVAPDRKAICEQWLTQTEEGKAFLRAKLPTEIFMFGESLPGNPMSPGDKAKSVVHHGLGYYMTEHEAKAGLKNRTLQIVPVKRAE